MQNKDVVEHLKDSLESKHGVRATWHIPGVQEKKNASMLERHGDTCPIRVPRIAEKVRATNVARYGVDNPYKSKAIMEKVQDCREKRTGYRNSGQNPAVRKKASDTIFKRTGYRHQMQDPKVFGRQQSSLRGQKPWVDKFGNTHMVRGCEPTVNSALEALGATVLSCEPKDMPPIRYVGKDGKTHRYFPDTVAKVGNTRWVIEAKERNGLLTRPGEFDKNKLKFSAAISRCSRYPDTVFVLGFMLKDKTVKFVKNPTSEKIEKIKALFN